MARLPIIVARLPIIVARLPIIVARLPIIVARLHIIAARLPMILARLHTIVARLGASGHTKQPELPQRRGRERLQSKERDHTRTAWSYSRVLVLLLRTAIESL